jgi:hypothetical protein
MEERTVMLRSGEIIQYSVFKAGRRSTWTEDIPVFYGSLPQEYGWMSGQAASWSEAGVSMGIAMVTCPSSVLVIFLVVIMAVHSGLQHSMERGPAKAFLELH